VALLQVLAERFVAPTPSRVSPPAPTQVAAGHDQGDSAWKLLLRSSFHSVFEQQSGADLFSNLPGDFSPRDTPIDPPTMTLNASLGEHKILFQRLFETYHKNFVTHFLSPSFVLKKQKHQPLHRRRPRPSTVSCGGAARPSHSSLLSISSVRTASST
jgi:hypothetical protein